MKPSRLVVLLSLLVALLAAVAAGAGLLWPGGEGPTTFVTVRGEAVELYGEGLYRHDTIFRAGANRGSDLVTLLVGIPLLLVALGLYLRASLRGALLLAGALTWFLYVYASVALGAAYSGLFLVHVALFSASLGAFWLLLVGLRPRAVADRFSERLPRRRIGAFMLACGAVTAGAWLTPLVASLVAGRPPGLLESYSTMVTDALDLGVITPACVVAGVLLLRGDRLGYLVALPLLVLVAFLAPMMAAQTWMQLGAGYEFSPGQLVGIIGSFGVISLVGAAAAVVVLRGLDEARGRVTPAAAAPA